MRFAFCIVVFLAALLPSCSGGTSWGEEMSLETPVGTATLFRSEEVSVVTAATAFQAMVDANYNFASNLPEQIDRIDGRLTLRLGNDNEDSIASIIADGEDDGAVSYAHGLAGVVSQAVGGEEVDIILCRKKLDDEFYTVKWKAEASE